MKNLDFALRVLAQVRVPVAFSVVGPEEDSAHVEQCRRLADTLPEHIKVCWRGSVVPREVPEVMAAHDLFFLPTRGENYGHVISEALGSGTPVLLSDNTSWRGLAADGLGADLPLSDPGAFATEIEALAALPAEAALARRTHIAQYIRARAIHGADVSASRNLFRAAAQNGSEIPLRAGKQ